MVNPQSDQISVKLDLDLSRSEKIADKLETIGKVLMHLCVVKYLRWFHELKKWTHLTKIFAQI